MGSILLHKATNLVINCGVSIGWSCLVTGSPEPSMILWRLWISATDCNLTFSDEWWRISRTFGRESLGRWPQQLITHNETTCVCYYVRDSSWYAIWTSIGTENSDWLPPLLCCTTCSIWPCGIWPCALWWCCISARHCATLLCDAVLYDEVLCDGVLYGCVLYEQALYDCSVIEEAVHSFPRMHGLWVTEATSCWIKQHTKKRCTAGTGPSLTWIKAHAFETLAKSTQEGFF